MVQQTSESSVTRFRIDTRSLISSLIWYGLYVWLRFRPLPVPAPKKGPQIWNFPPPAKLIRGCHAEQWTSNGWACTILSPSIWRSQPKPSAPRQILYLHGGGFCMAINPLHWQLCSTLANELDAEVILVPYPLAPANGVDEVAIHTRLAILMLFRFTFHHSGTANSNAYLRRCRRARE